MKRYCNLKHRLGDIVLGAFRGVLAGCDNFVEITKWARLHHGIPSHDTCNRVFVLLRPQALHGLLIPWLQQPRGITGDWVHLDGKTLRASRSRAKDLGALHLVSTWASQHDLLLGQVAVDAEPNELAAIPHLLELLDLRDQVVTIDAAGCQKDIAAQTVAGGGDYVLAVKANQPTLHQEIAQAFATALKTDGSVLRHYRSIEIRYGRHAERIVYVLPAAPYVSCREAWVGLRTLVLVVRIVTCRSHGMGTVEGRYFISSLRPSARRLAGMIRGHWSIENGLHWVLDVVFREDARRLYDRRAAENVALLHRLALSLLRGDPGKGSLTVKRKRAGWNTEYLTQLLGLPSPLSAFAVRCKAVHQMRCPLRDRKG